MIIPALNEESIIVPTAQITKAGPALTEESIILFASSFEILFCLRSSDAIEHPVGNPEHSENKATIPAVGESPRIPTDTANEEITRKGKREGIIVPAHISRPFFIPSAEIRGNFNNKKMKKKHTSI